jgi:hypothetical protein
MTGTVSQEGNALGALDILDVLNDGGGGDRRIAVDDAEGLAKLREWARLTNRSTVADMLRHILRHIDIVKYRGAYHIISLEDPKRYPDECQDESRAGE